MDVAEVNGTEKSLILLMDDNEDVRSYIKSILDDDYILLEAPNGEEGVRMAKAFIPDRWSRHFNMRYNYDALST